MTGGGPFPGLRVALVHDWLTGMRGGEKVLDALGEVFPTASILTFVHVPGRVAASIERHPIRRGLARLLPRPARWYRHYLALYPFLVEQFDLDDFDLVISSSHCAVKAVVRPGRARHLCYCHSPMRYAWDQFPHYFGVERLGRTGNRLSRHVLAALARWDAATAGRVDRYVANSQHVARRIRRYYNRRACVVYPPVDTGFFKPDLAPPEPFFLIVSALVPYKRIDMAIEACGQVGVPLQIVGEGPERSRLEAMAGPDVEFLGPRTNEEIRRLYQRATATLLPGEEDFGISPVEAMACGRPVVALAAGGALETIADGVTGVLVPRPTAEAFALGLQRVRDERYDLDAMRTHALRFSRERFKEEMIERVQETLDAGETPQW